MQITVSSVAFAFAASCAGLMGYAIQRGATCTVAAVEEIVNKRKLNRLAAIVEASVWVAGGLAVAQALGMLGTMPGGYRVDAWTLAGGCLLGLGAYVNRACVFGAIARFGSGEWSYVLTPVGFYAGCVSVGAVLSPLAHQKLDHGSPVLQGSAWAAVLFAGFIAWRAGCALRRDSAPRGRAGSPAHLWEQFAKRAWSPHGATTVIGITFFFMLLLVGAWSYTDVLAELAHGMANSLAARSLLLLALLVGAAIGGYTAGRFRHTPVSVGQLARCFAGGVLMGWGSLFIPGGNDGLVLVGMPLLWPYAWAAFAMMCVSIAAALRIEKSASVRIQQRAAASQSTS
jgi:hypothetical protein